MRKIKTILTSLLILILATGCVKMDTTIKINSDKSVNYSIIYAMNKDMLKESKKDNIFTAEEVKSIEKQGYTVKEYSDEKMKGYTISKDYGSIDDLSKVDEDVKFNLSYIDISDNNGKIEKTPAMFKKVKVGENKTKYIADFVFENSKASDMVEDVSEGTDAEAFESSDNSSNDSEDSDFDMSNITSMMNDLSIKLEVTLPEKPISNNASTVSDDGKTLKWDFGSELMSSKNPEAKFEFELSNNAGNILGIDKTTFIMIVAGLAVVIIAVAIVMVNKKKPDTAGMGTVNLNAINNIPTSEDNKE